MIDLPANWQDQLQQIDWAKIQEKVSDYGPALKIIKDTWDRETLAEISQGNLFVSDKMLNEAIAKNIKGDSPVRSVLLESKENGRLNITIDTAKIGKVELSGEVKEFVHEGDKSYMVYRVRERNIPHHGLMSWVFSRISLAMAQRMVGKLSISEDLPVEIKHNNVRIDYSKVLAESDFGRTMFHGHRLLDMIEIEKATPKEGGIMFQTKLNIPEDVKDDLKSLLPQKNNG
ncbi:hypothetical protein [Selenomonas ruminantium]|uniref:hypothetical protein n=1 Tax=Selenomonas ruminantium TaxID=971 RepID=UPI0026F21E03|nr:hypothetical protein [Selenomonas ruminantium]